MRGFQRKAMVDAAGKKKVARSMTGDTWNTIIRWLVSIEVHCGRYNVS